MSQSPHDNFGRTPATPSHPVIGNPVIRASGIEMHFRRADALRGVDLQINPGTVFALLGENGAGKTTLIRILTGFQKPSAGSATVCGIDPTRDPQAVRRQIGYVSDSPALYPWMTVAQIGGFAASLYDASFLVRYQESIARFDIDAHQKIKHLSKGQRAKVALSLSLSHDPALLILDEPTSGLDPKVRKNFLESMIDRAAIGQTVFLSSHQISEVERVADEIAILHEGKIVLRDSLEAIRRSVAHLIIEVDDSLRALPRLPAPAEVLSEDTSGRQRRSIVRHLSPAMIQFLREQEGVIDVRHRTASLEEVFVAYTSDQLSLGDGGDDSTGDGNGNPPSSPPPGNSRKQPVAPEPGNEPSSDASSLDAEVEATS